jgi:uncharacterized repeat protein (TIGR02543 family)
MSIIPEICQDMIPVLLMKRTIYSYFRQAGALLLISLSVFLKMGTLIIRKISVGNTNIARIALILDIDLDIQHLIIHYNPYIDVWGARYGGPISGSNTKIQYYDSVQDTNSNGPVYFLCQYPANWHIVNFEYWADVITIHRSGNDRRSTVSYLLTVTTGFTVSYNYNGGSGSPSSVQNTTYVTLPSPSKSGYDFAGWYDEGGNYVGWSNGGYNVSRNVTLTAHWNLKTYWQNININDPNGTEGMGNVGTFSYYGSDGWHTNVTDQGSGTTVQRWTHIYVKDIKITAQGMHFKNVTAAGGSITQNGDTWDYTSPEGNGTININTAWNNYTVTYHTNGGTGSPDGAKDSWTYESSGNLRGKESLQRAYTITYKTNLASDTHSKNVTGVADGQTDTSTYSVIGWSTTAGDINNPDNVAKQYDFNQSVKNLTAENNANVDLYAVWRTQSKTLPTLVRQGYTFEGWYDSALGGNKIGDGGAAYIPRKDITLYAHWSPITYHAYYSLYGGSAKVRKDFTVEDTFTLNAPTVNQNYTFLGWIGDTDPQDHGAWGSGGAAITGPQKSPTVPAGTYGDVFFRAVYQPTVDALIQHKNAYYAKSSSQEMKY